MIVNYYSIKEPTIPNYLIIGLDEELRRFREVIEYVNIPEKALGLYIEQIIETMLLVDEKYFESSLDNIIEIDEIDLGLYDTPRVDQYEILISHEAVLQLGIAIKNKLISLNLYLDGIIPYMFFTMLNKNSIVLKFYHGE